MFNTRHFLLSLSLSIPHFLALTLSNTHIHITHITRTKVQHPERRESHYRKPRIETTLVSFLGEAVHPLIKQFRQDVDNLLPGCYTWFGDTSLHLTIRALA